MQDIQTMITEVIEREGRSYTNHPADRGGPTKFGITLRTLTNARGRPCVAADVEALDEREAREIYEQRYLIAPRFHTITDPYVLALAFDCGVNHGTRRATQWLQRIVGTPADGMLGPITELAINTYEPVRLFNHLLARRIEFYGEVISHDDQLQRAKQAGLRLQAENALGWLRRAAAFLESP